MVLSYASEFDPDSSTLPIWIEHVEILEMPQNDSICSGMIQIEKTVSISSDITN